MTLAHLRNLANKWYPGNGGPFQTALDDAFDKIGFTHKPGFVASAIDAYTAGNATNKPKVIKDSVWGMVEFDPQSIRLIESPVVQRLRGVKQLGFSYLTYPSAEHSRFIHSLGMYCVVARFLDAISRRMAVSQDTEAQRYPVVGVTEPQRKDILHAAILHDIGHMPFSHASEKILESDADKFRIGDYELEDFLFDVQNTLEKDLPLSECLSLAIILSPRFRNFYQNYVRPGESDPEAIYRIAALIAGIRPKPDLRGAADLISEEVVDADKVDYINRDAEACGIPVGVDVARLFLQSSFFRVPREDLKRLDPNREPLCDKETIFVVNSSGVDTVEELAQARSALYQRVYLHQATRNAERLLGHALAAFANEPSSISDLDLQDVLQIWALDDFSLLNNLSIHQRPEVAQFATRLRTRQLPKRSCVFGRRMITTFMPVKDIFPSMPALKRAEVLREVTGLSLQDLREKRLTGPKLVDLEEKIAEEASKISTILRKKMPELAPVKDRPDVVSVLPMPKLENKRKDCIILENKELCYSGTLSISDEQGEGADIYKSLGYIMTDPDWRQVVLLAARTVFHQRRLPPKPIRLHPYEQESLQPYEVRCVGHVTLDTESVIRRVGLDAGDIEGIQKVIEEAGYFDKMPRLATPVSHLGDIATIATNLQSFCGQGDWRITPDTCVAFVEQFPPRLRRGVLDLLLKMTILERPTLSADIIQAIDKYGPPKSGTGFLAALSPDSGNFVRMLIEQGVGSYLTDKGWTICKSIREAFGKAKHGEDLILCDDNMVSGSQAECQFMAWCEVPREQWRADQRNERGIDDAALDDRDLELLRSMNLAIAVCRGSTSAEKRLTTRFQSLGINEFHGVFFAENVSPADTEISEELEAFLKRVGSDVLASCRYDTNAGADKISVEQRADCDANALGYGNVRGLVSTIFNVPVSTFTAFWCPGMSNGEPWIPLFIRRGYLQHLILA